MNLIKAQKLNEISRLKETIENLEEKNASLEEVSKKEQTEKEDALKEIAALK